MIFYPLNLAPGTVLLRLIVSLMRCLEIKTSVKLNSFLRTNNSQDMLFLKNRQGQVIMYLAIYLLSACPEYLFFLAKRNTLLLLLL